MNIYQAASKLRQDFAHTGIELGATDCSHTNLYFIFHDALHTYLGKPPEEEYEKYVLSTELLLGGQDASCFNLEPEVSSNLLASIPVGVLEIMMDFYTNWFNK